MIYYSPLYYDVWRRKALALALLAGDGQGVEVIPVAFRGVEVLAGDGQGVRDAALLMLLASVPREVVARLIVRDLARAWDAAAALR